MYNYKDVLTALQVLYSLGADKIKINYFMYLFCNSKKLDKKYKVHEEEENIKQILYKLDQLNKIKIKKDTIHLHKTYYCMARVELTMSEE